MTFCNFHFIQCFTAHVICESLLSPSPGFSWNVVKRLEHFRRYIKCRFDSFIFTNVFGSELSLFGFTFPFLQVSSSPTFSTRINFVSDPLVFPLYVLFHMFII